MLTLSQVNPHISPARIAVSIANNRAAPVLALAVFKLSLYPLILTISSISSWVNLCVLGLLAFGCCNPTIGEDWIYPHRSSATLNICLIVDSSLRTLSPFTVSSLSFIQNSKSCLVTSEIYLSVIGWRKNLVNRLNSCFSPRFVGVISFRYRLITSENSVLGCRPLVCSSIFFSSSAPHKTASDFVEQVLDFLMPSR